MVVVVKPQLVSRADWVGVWEDGLLIFNLL